jgi:hypothetical protein
MSPKTLRGAWPVMKQALPTARGGGQHPCRVAAQVEAIGLKLSNHRPGARGMNTP